LLLERLRHLHLLYIYTCLTFTLLHAPDGDGVIEAPKPPSQKPGYTRKSRLAMIILLFVCQIIVGRVMMQSFVIVACIQVTVAKTTVDVGQQLHLVAYVVFAPLVQFFQHLLGLL